MRMNQKRPDRRMPPLRKIAEHWLDRPEWPDYKGNYIGLGEPFCARCGWLAPVEDGRPDSWDRAGKFLDRAHLIDRIKGGLDGVQNLVPLCHLCHDTMPSFGPGQEEEAYAWVRSGKSCDWHWQLTTDALGSAGRHAMSVYMTSQAVTRDALTLIDQGVEAEVAYREALTANGWGHLYLEAA